MAYGTAEWNHIRGVLTIGKTLLYAVALDSNCLRQPWGENAGYPRRYRIPSQKGRHIPAIRSKSKETETIDSIEPVTMLHMRSSGALQCNL